MEYYFIFFFIGNELVLVSEDIDCIMNNLSNFLKLLRKQKNLTLIELSKEINLSKSTISNVERNSTKITPNIIQKYRNYFNIPENTIEIISKNKNNLSNNELNKIFNDTTNLTNDNKLITLPYFESISAGIEQELNDNNPIDYIQIPNYENFFKNEKDLFAVKVNGESMNKIIPNGSTVVLDTNIDKSNFKNGDIIAYQLDNEFGLKRIYETPDKILLVPESWDETYKTKELKIENINQLYSFSVVGKLIYQFNKSF